MNVECLAQSIASGKYLINENNFLLFLLLLNQSIYTNMIESNANDSRLYKKILSYFLNEDI